MKRKILMMNALAVLTITSFSITACKKYLDKISDDSLTVPLTIDDFQQLLDADFMYLAGDAPALGDYASDDVELPLSDLQSMPSTGRNTYLWADDIFEGQTCSDWNLAYKAIYYSNIVLEGAEKIAVTNSNAVGIALLKSKALYFRGSCHFYLSQIFAKPYSQSGANTDPGLIYKTNSLVDAKVQREILKKTYDDILGDLKNSISGLPENVPTLAKNRPSKPAAYAILARVYLSMSDYSNALLYADSALLKGDLLTDLNTKSPDFFFPFSRPFISEILCFSAAQFYVVFPTIDSTLYNSYDENDLRKQLYFRTNDLLGTHQFRGSYNGGVNPFNGPATDEVYLIKAECLARSGNNEAALDVMNKLLILRYATGSYNEHTTGNTPDALSFIIGERRKELLFRGIRWSDLRRYNQENGAYKKDLTRIVDGTTYSLPANSNKYTFPIPPDEILRSGVTQNPR